MEENLAIELHDSTLESIESHGEVLVARLTAYVHRSSGRPGIDAGSGWSQELHLCFSSGLASGSHNILPMEILQGYIESAGQRLQNTIPIPFVRGGPVTLVMNGWNEQRVEISGVDLEAVLVGEARFVEQFPGTKG